MKRYGYLISFFCNGSGYGSCYVTQPYKIKTYSDVTKVAEKIKEENNLKTIAIFNIVKLKVRREK